MPAKVRSLAERCLAKDPGQRPTTGALLAELGDADLAAGWLPAPIVNELSWRAEIPEPAEPARPVTAKIKIGGLP